MVDGAVGFGTPSVLDSAEAALAGTDGCALGEASCSVFWVFAFDGTAGELPWGGVAACALDVSFEGTGGFGCAFAFGDAAGEDDFISGACLGADVLTPGVPVMGMFVLLSGMANPRVDAQSVIEFVVHGQQAIMQYRRAVAVLADGGYAV